MAYTGINSTYRTVNSGGSKSSFPQQQDQHIYEEQSYYVNERPKSTHSIDDDDRRNVK
ncbi:unnamed protein product, partial [Rotaria magnacalcarata]